MPRASMTITRAPGGRPIGADAAPARDTATLAEPNVAKTPQAIQPTEKIFVWHLTASNKFEGEILDIPSPHDAAIRHAEQAKLQIGRKVYATREGSIELFEVELNALPA